MNLNLVEKFLLISSMLFGLTQFTHAADVTGIVHAINFNKHPGWNGVSFQLESTSGNLITIDPACGNGTWGFMRIENDLDKSIISALITSKATGKKVRVGFNDCLRPPEVLADVPLVQWVDLGIRN